MKLRLLAVAPLLATGALVSAGLLLGAHGYFYYRWVVVAKAAAAAAGLGAALQFRPRDHLFRAWSASMLGYLLLAGVDVVGWGHAATGVTASPAVSEARAVLLVAANLIGIIPAILFASTLRVAGLVFPGTTLRRVAVLLLTLVLAVVLTGPALLEGLKDFAAGQMVDGTLDLAVNLGDAIPIVLLAPLFLTALSLRGGALAWPFGLYTAATFTWLLFDATNNLTGNQPWEEALVHGCRFLACLFIAAAAASQIVVSREARKRLEGAAVASA